MLNWICTAIASDERDEGDPYYSIDSLSRVPGNLVSLAVSNRRANDLK